MEKLSYKLLSYIKISTPLCCTKINLRRPPNEAEKSFNLIHSSNSWNNLKRPKSFLSSYSKAVSYIDERNQNLKLLLVTFAVNLVLVICIVILNTISVAQRCI